MALLIKMMKFKYTKSLLNTMDCIVVYILFAFFTKFTTSDEQIIRKTLPMPDFRKKVEEISTDDIVNENNNDNLGSLESVMVRNIKQLFQSESPAVFDKIESKINDYTVFNKQKENFTISTENSDDAETFTDVGSSDLYGDIYVNVTTSLDELIEKIKDSKSSWPYTHINRYKKLNYKSLENRWKEEEKDFRELANALSNPNSDNGTSSRKLWGYNGIACVTCDNVLTEECSSPDNKLVPLKFCMQKDDVCFSQHTPFGLVRRGCYNLNHNLTVYVCSCNLCNSLSIGEMPYLFPTKENWKKNIIEMSRTRRFRKTLFKDMSCLRCEVNSTLKNETTSSNINCLEGNVGNLPTQECTENEICGIKSIKSQGYIWRGCVSKPLYNYWWFFCDKGLCNVDSRFSIYA